jgi:hypothetical protein
VLSVTPNVATTSHSAAFPTNQVQFEGVVRLTAPQGCPVPNVALQDYAAWTNPDPINIQISSANDATNGTAVCKGPTNGAVTLTGTFAAVAGGTAGNGLPQTIETVQLIFARPTIHLVNKDGQSSAAGGAASPSSAHHQKTVMLRSG